MDAGGCRNERRCPPEETEGLWQHHVMESSSQGGGREEESAPWRLVDVLLSGGAPWGFTLRGGREHREPLLITKVEEASRAAAVSLQVGDELVNINEIPLSGSRQEAICLVKGSHKTLALVVKRHMNMVDIVAQKMPSESDVHVARSFLTKILRSSMRRSEPISRPHSWHATKFNESQPETTAKTQSPPAQVWHTRYDASSSSTDLSSGWEQTNLRRVSDQFSSLGSMDSLEHVSPHHPYPPTKSHNNSQEHLDPGGGKRDSAYSSFSTSSGTPDYTLSKSNAASTENMLYKVSQWDSAGQQGGVAKHGGGGARQPGQSLTDGAKQQDDRPGYLHVAGGGGTGGRDSPARADSPQAGSRHSSSSRASCGPVWHVPERKKATSSPSPPPPLPPVRSDSFAATKVVHERGLVIAYPESPETTHVVVYPKAHEKAPEKRTEPADNAKRAAESRRSHVPPAKSDTDQFYFTPDSYNQNQFGSNRQYSLSSSDVRLGGQPSQPYSQWHYTSGDQSTLYSQTKTVSVAKPTQNISGYYSSMQELPTAACSTGQLYGPNNQGRNSSNPTAVASSTPAVINQNPDSAAHRYYCVTARQPGGHPLLGKMTEDKKGAAGMEVTQVTNDPQTVHKAKYQLPSQQLQQHIKNTNGYGKQEDGLCHKQTPVAASPAAMPETLLAKPALDDRGGGQRRIHSQNAETPYASKQPEQRRSLPATLQQQRELPQEVRRPKQEGGAAQICPRATPMLHSLSAETADRDAVESLDGGKQVRRADRFATTLRNEIQMRRANLQKSVSAAALTGAEAADPEGNDDDDDDVWKSKGGSAPTSYKDNLKEAQARVLKATSFRRRDLEPVLLEHPSAESSAPPAYSAALRKDLGSLPTVSESLAGKAGPPPVTRIGGRKRFPAEKKARSFSEPDKIHEVGTTEEATPSENNQRKHFEVAGKPAFPKPPPMQYYYEDPKEANSTVLLGSTGQPEGPASAKGIQCRAVEYGVTEDQSALHSVLHGTQTTTLLEQQRLGTFAEYEARWNVQKKAGETTRASGGRYHSADNILDPGPGEEVTKPSCFHHERSRSSPSADFYRQQKAPAPGRKSAEYSQQEECQAVEQSGSDASSSDRGGVSDCEQPRGEEEEEQLCPLPAEPVEHFPPPMTGPPNPDGSRPPATSVYHRPPSVSHSPPTDLSVPSSEAQAQQPGPPGGKKKKKAPVPLPKPDDSSKRPEVAAAAAPSNPRTTDPPAIAPHRSSVNGGFGSSPGPAHSPETAGGGGDRGHGATNPLPASPPTAPPRSSSSHGPPALPPPPPPPPALAAMDGHRSPSPQFSPQRLSDKPPLSLQDECCNRMDSVMENNDNNNSSAVRKVPIKIVHSESVSEKESRQYLLHSSDDGVVAPPAMECQQGGVPPSPGTTTTAPPRLGGSAEQQDYSVFCAYTRQRDHPQSGDPLLLPPPDANGDHANDGSLGLALCQEDQKREELVRDITGKDPSLVDILDQSKMMTTMDLMEGIFPGGQQLLEEAHHHQLHNHHQRRKAAPKQTPAEDREDDSVSAAMGVVTSSTYYSTSAPKAEMLIKMKDMQQEEEEEDSEDELDVDLANKKQELMDSLSRKLQVLREARESLQEDILDNKALGDEVEATVQALCKPNELDKFRMFVGDLDKVVSLLLSLSGRLARVENALNSPDEDTTPEERRTLTEKRKLLIRQHEDAKELKDNLDRREGVVYDIVASYLDEDGLADYQHFVKMKSALIIEQRKLEDKIKLGDEQLKCLMDSLPLEQRLSL